MNNHKSDRFHLCRFSKTSAPEPSLSSASVRSTCVLGRLQAVRPPAFPTLTASLALSRPSPVPSIDSDVLSFLCRLIATLPAPSLCHTHSSTLLNVRVLLSSQPIHPSTRRPTDEMRPSQPSSPQTQQHTTTPSPPQHLFFITPVLSSSSHLRRLLGSDTSATITPSATIHITLCHPMPHLCLDPIITPSIATSQIYDYLSPSVSSSPVTLVWTPQTPQKPPTSAPRRSANRSCRARGTARSAGPPAPPEKGRLGWPGTRR